MEPSRQPIGELGFLSDLHSSALIDTAGRVVWLSFPRFDSRSVFAALLDDDAGVWRIAPDEDAEVSRRYVGRSLVLETTFRARTGTLVVTDALALGESQEGHLLGAGAPHVLLRRATCTQGRVDVRVEFVPRPEYARALPLLRAVDGGLITRGGPDALRLSSDVAFVVEGSAASASFQLEEGEERGFAASWGRAWGEVPAAWSRSQIDEALEHTVASWEGWSNEHQAYDGPWKELVWSSGRVLQGLTYQPSGAIIAAPTTSLPEVIGGERNWDYRYAWIRDASLTLRALWVAACPAESDLFLRFLVNASSADLRRGADLQIMYGVGSEHELVERELDHLSGWRGSRPVRVGNGAWDQRQLDVYGELLDATAVLRERIGELDELARDFLVACADAAARRWTESDQGIWEVRGQPQHFVHSKLMCWVALDRAIGMADWLEAEDRVDRWTATREEIASAITERGWHPGVGAFTQAFGSEVLDAAALTIPIFGLLPATDERVRSTVERIEARLTDPRGLVHRYEHVTRDGLGGEEGTFLLCTFWLAQCHALAGDVARAREVFERAIACRNDLGLLAEEVHPETGELLGNFPQAFSHVGLANAAWAIHQAERDGA